MGLVDNEGKPLERGIYALPRDKDSSNPDVLLLFYQDERGVWMSKAPDGDVHLVGSRTQEGVAADAFSRVPEQEVKKYITGMRQHREEVTAKINFLEKFVREELPTK